jgi:hypothetical protein
VNGAVIVAGPKDVLDGELGEMGVLVSGELGPDYLRHLGCHLPAF